MALSLVMVVQLSSYCSMSLITSELDKSDVYHYVCYWC